MRKLELKDIVGYLPYDLQVYNEQQDSKIDTIIGIFKGTFDFEYWSPLNSDIENYKPILHPISDLTKPIKVDGYNEGKEFIPLVELAKKSDDIVSEYSLEIIKSVPNCIEIGDGYILQYLGHSFMCFDKDDAQYSPINNVHLFDLLNQWHFDYRNLIEDGLAVDINTINNILNKKNYD
jgi:hypothetical protein